MDNGGIVGGEVGMKLQEIRAKEVVAVHSELAAVGWWKWRRAATKAVALIDGRLRSKFGGNTRRWSGC